MDSTILMQIGVVALAALSVGMIVYVLVYPYISGEKQADKRLSGVTSDKARFSASAGGGSESQQALQQRRKQIEDTLKDIEEKKTKKRLTMRLRILQAGLEMTPRTFYIASLIAGVILFGVVNITGNPLWVSLVAGFVAAAGAPRWLLAQLKKRRLKKFIDEFATSIDVIVRGVKSGLPLNDCLGIVARESSEPLKSEFADLVEQQRVGVPLGECFNRMMETTPLQEVNFFAIVIAIQQQAGGNLAEALGNLAQVLRDRKMLTSKVKALSAEARMSAIIIGILPFGVVTCVYMSAPEYISLLWKEPMGHFMMMVSLGWMFIGILIMRKMINFSF